MGVSAWLRAAAASMPSATRSRGPPHMTAEQAMKTEKMAERSMVVGDDDERSLRSGEGVEARISECLCVRRVRGRVFL